MKLHRRTFQIFWDVHAWGGLISALILYVMFFAAAFAPFEPALTAWAEPGAHAARPGPRKLAPLLDQLMREAGAAGPERIAFSFRDGLTSATVSAAASTRELFYASDTGQLEPRRSELAHFLYELHYLGPIPGGIYVAGVASLLLGLALVTGLLIQLKDFVRQWFQFRSTRAARTVASDLHKLLGVLGLPFQLFYAWSGAVLCLSWACVQPAFTATVFHGDVKAALAEVGYAEPVPPVGRTGAVPINLDELVRKAERAVPGLAPTWIGIEHPGDEAASLQIYGTVPSSAFGNAEVSLRASDGAILRVSTPGRASPRARFEAWLFGLHYVAFGAGTLDFVYALLALATCAVILSGNLIWLWRRDRSVLGNRLLEGLTLGVGVGMPLAVCVMFAANRVFARAPALPSHEKLSFWLAFAVAVLGGLVSGRTRKPRPGTPKAAMTTHTSAA